jgi:hypothetical protein
MVNQVKESPKVAWEHSPLNGEQGSAEVPYELEADSDEFC